MEFVGRTVKKELQGFGILSGVVNSYDQSSGFFEIVFQDGDSEELEFAEVALLLEGMVEPATAELIEKQTCGRRPKKRRREDPNWEIRDDSGKSADSLVKHICSEEGSEETQMKDKVFHGGSSDILDNECWFGPNLGKTVLVNGNSTENVSSDGLNLNVTFEENLKKNVYFDGNLKANGAFDDSLGSAEETQKKEGGFDVNLCFHDETEITNANSGGDLEKNTSLLMLEGTRMKELGDGEKFASFGSVEEAQMKGGISNGSLEEDIYLGVVEEIPVKGTSGLGDNVTGDACLGFVEEIQEECMDFSPHSKGNDSGVFDFSYRKDSSFAELQLKEGNSDAGVIETQGNGSDFGTPDKDEYGRKKRKRISEDLKSKRGSVLRRSSRRITTFSSQIDFSSMEKSQAVNNVPSSPSVNADSEGKPIAPCCEGSEEQSNLPGKLELPPSSKNLKLDEIPILDLFSVYACLRSFSTLLFLSPFDLEAFVEALKYNLANSLIDFIHLSILQTLKLHLEFLSNEGSQSASGCLRSLNWELLDLITWPLFMVEYLLLCGSRLKPGFDLISLKLMIGDYYKQPAAVKLELLRCLCDDVIEAEVIRLELNRRTLASERIMDVDRMVNTEICKKRKDLMDDLGGSCLTQEIVDETIDWNSDECCLCKMDGSLICCDGCPAAYHSRCVGVAKDLLPEGEWYCPECVIEKHEPWMKSRKSLRGAELLGIDPHGRLYFGSCGYLLVLDSCDTESLYYYYHRNDLNAVIQMLKSADILYSGITTAISMHWDIPVDSTGGKGHVDSHNHIISGDLVMDSQISAISTFSLPVPHSETNEVKDEAFNERKSRENSVIAEDFGHPSYKVSQSVNRLENVTANQLMEMPSSFASSEGSAEISQAATGIQTSQKTGADCLNKSAGTSKDSEIPKKVQCSIGDCSLRSHECEERNVECAIPGHTPSLINPRKGEASQMQFETGYINYYSFAQTSASVAEELMCKSLDNINEDSSRSAEEIISAQLKAISKKSTKFCWPNVQKLNMDAQKENCGWCFSCKTPTDSRDCVFNTNTKKPAPEGSKSEVVGFRTKSRKSHLIVVMCHILSMEDRLCGLLLGPWQDPHHTKLWRKSFLKAFDVAFVKHLLLALELNLRRVSLSAEWLKQVDSVVTMGSASHVITNSVHASSKHGIGRKRARFSEPESNSSSNAATRSAIFWWRGGRLSRQVFHWKALPRSLASKCGRQGGCTKIPGILYSDGSEFAKRSKYVAWRAAVEMSTNLAQLAFQVRELDSNIRWDDLENTHLSSQLSKESKKLMRPFKKVTIRRKCIEGTTVKYLLDFGKRKTIPDTVIKHGFMLEASSSERKKYWLDETHVPLYLLKAFEEKKLARKSNKTNSGKLPEAGGRLMKKPSKKSWLSYLLSKVEKSENYQCGHCNKDVLVREAAKCQYCKGFFHKRHVKKSEGSIIAECTYTCHRCHDEKHVKIKTGKRKVRSQKTKKASTDCRPTKSRNNKKASTDGRPVRSQNSKKPSTDGRLLRSHTKKVATDGRPKRSAKKVKYMSLQRKKLGGRQKGKQVQAKKRVSKTPKKSICWHKRKRTPVYHAYWLNGLLLSRNQNDERARHFREGKFLLSSKHATAALEQPKCCLCCEGGYASTLVYVGCEICKDWFHGDALGVTVENIVNLLGFRCHRCLKRNPPVCPHWQDVTNDGVQLHEAKDNAGNECVVDVSDVELPSVRYEKQIFPLHEDSPGSFRMHGSVNKEQKVDTPPDSYQAHILECVAESEKGHISINEEQKEDAILVSIDEEQKPDALTDSYQTLMLEESITDSEKGNTADVESLVEARHPSCKSDEDVVETGVELLGHKAEEGRTVITAIPEFLVAGTLGDSSELHPSTTLSPI